ncbi:hypothetical protein Bca101_018454 [Brassica carinata]
MGKFLPKQSKEEAGEDIRGRNQRGGEKAATLIHSDPTTHDLAITPGLLSTHPETFLFDRSGRYPRKPEVICKEREGKRELNREEAGHGRKWGGDRRVETLRRPPVSKAKKSLTSERRMVGERRKERIHSLTSLLLSSSTSSNLFPASSRARALNTFSKASKTLATRTFVSSLPVDCVTSLTNNAN